MKIIKKILGATILAITITIGVAFLNLAHHNHEITFWQAWCNGMKFIAIVCSFSFAIVLGYFLLTE